MIWQTEIIILKASLMSCKKLNTIDILGLPTVIEIIYFIFNVQ